MPAPSRTIAVTIERPHAVIYDWLAEPRNWPAWASGLGEGLVLGDTGWTAGTPAGLSRLRFAERNGFGVLDHVVALPGGVEVHVPMRVIPNGDGADVVLTLFRQPEMTDAAFEADAEWVRRDLAALKRLLEAVPATEGDHT